MARSHARRSGHHLGRTARVTAVHGLGAAVLMVAFALPARAEAVTTASNDRHGRSTHVVKAGETLAGIAKAAKLPSWRPVYDLNKSIQHPDLIYPGQKLVIPAKGEKVKHRPLPGPGISRLPEQDRSPVRTQQPASSQRSAAVGGSGSPHTAGRAEQIRVAQRVLASQGWGAWPSCSARLGLR